MRRFRLILLLVLGVLLTSCGEQDYVLNPDFSVNMFTPGPKWPKVKKLSAAEKEIYERYGKPDAFRVLWNPTGKLRSRMEVSSDFNAKKIKSMPPFTWVYVKQGKEIAFKGAGYEELPLTDEVRLLVEYGDPEDVKEIFNGVTQWMFYGAGKLFKLSNGKIVEQKDFPAMGRFQKM